MGVTRPRFKDRSLPVPAAATPQRRKALPSRPKPVTGIDAFTAGLERMRWIFDEFDGQVTVDNSGGKDSTVVVELGAMVARERGQKLRVQWLDQECEYQSTRDYQRYLKDRDDIEFHWYQVPFKLFNATNHEDPWLEVWDPALGPDGWARPKEPDTIHEHDFRHKDGRPVDRFSDMLTFINRERGGALCSGLRCQESPARRLTTTTNPMYKWVTWSTAGTPAYGYTMFHPIYDWTTTDVWKAIHDNGWRYNTAYDAMYRWGTATPNMRVSNYHHETALMALSWLQEIEPQTWEAATRRLQGISTQGHIGGADQFPKQLPYMFGSWEEYMRHLIDNLVPTDQFRAMMSKLFTDAVGDLPETPREVIAKKVARAVVINDLYGTTVDSWKLAIRAKAKMDRARIVPDEGDYAEEALV